MKKTKAIGRMVRKDFYQDPLAFMNSAAFSPSTTPRWTITLALVYLYIGWGTTYLAIKHGVRDEHLPPALFAGARVCLAGVLLLGCLAWRRCSLNVSRSDLGRIVVTGITFFVGGNGLLTLAEQTVASGVASVLAATTPIWVALLGWAGPRHERLRAVGWLGLLIGLAGVVFLLVPEIVKMRADNLFDPGPLYMLGSTLSWAVGIVLLRHRPARCDHLVASGYQMAVGGGVLTLIGLLAGEGRQLPEEVTAGAVVTFTYLLVVGSLLGFIAFNFLLRHVSAALVGTHAYVNPIIAVLIGCLWGGESISGWIALGILSVLVGVFLVRADYRPGAREHRTDNSGDHPESGLELQEASAQR